MLVLLPPSETKRPGGSGGAWRPDALSFPSLEPHRREVTAALVALSAYPDEAARLLKLGATQRTEVAVNAALADAPGLPAVDRYTGVLYDALDAASLDPAARRWLGRSVAIHSAPFGPVRALERIPAYRLGAGVSLPGLRALPRLWGAAVTAAIADAQPGFVLDLRSEAYVALGPVPASVPSVYLRVVTETEAGTTRALNHFNKHAKGALVRALAEQRPRVPSVAGLRRWADAAGWRLRDGRTGELDLVV
ncbi:peroxide stress protein YaaA [Microbacterium sp. 1P10UB]|uniref:YaaA family protein n=1 Tax=unclassified Microbacterium TaxID=2609290 RepID=UPI0039A1F4E2